MHARPIHDINALRKEILCLGGTKQLPGQLTVPQGLSFMHEHFPLGQFPVSCMHECYCSGSEDAAATSAFVSGIISTCLPGNGVVIWIGPRTAIFPPSLAAFDLTPEKVIFIHPTQGRQTSWVAEEALSTPGVKAVAVEMRSPDFTLSRKLQLAVEKSRATGFVFSPTPAVTASNACFARWRIISIPSQTPGGMPGVGFPRWKVELMKIRNGKPGSWEIEWVNKRFKQVSSAEIEKLSTQWQVKTG